MKNRGYDVDLDFALNLQEAEDNEHLVNLQEEASRSAPKRNYPAGTYIPPALARARKRLGHVDSGK